MNALTLPGLSALLSIATIIFSNMASLKGKAITLLKHLRSCREGGYGPLRALDAHPGTSQTRHEGARDKAPPGCPGCPAAPWALWVFLLTPKAD